MTSALKTQPPYPWLRPTWQVFIRQVEENRLPHAILLVGPDGVGCVELSLAMAQYLLCIAPQSGQSCGKCKSCLLMKVQSHPDLHVITLEMNEKTKKISQAIKIDQIRGLADTTANTAQQGGRKLIVIYPAEAMNANAANALLKNLEEPNGDCVYILVSEQAAFLMATIRSRCSRVVVPLPPQDEAITWLERNQINDAAKRLHSVGGRPLRVIEWLEKDLWGQREKLQSHLLKLIKNEQSFLDCAKAISSDGPLWLIEQMQSWLILALPESLQAQSSLTVDQADPIVIVLKRQSSTKLITLYDNLLAKKKLVLSSANPNPQLVIEELLMQIQELGAGSR